jgi:thiamine-monophosphate kinase
MNSENQLVERTGRAIPSIRGRNGFGGVRLGIGDDAAVIASGGGREWVLTCDQFLEGVHFLGGVHPADSVGYKALSRATSDIAAMGGTPRLFLLALAIPASRMGAWFGGFLRGMSRAARELGLRLAGGDTTKAPKVSINITVLGEIEPGLAVTRAGAQPGDIIYVSGRLGRAQLGLELVRRGLGGRAQFRELLRPHLYPQIQVKLGAWLAAHGVPSAMMDISDGLSTDLRRLCAASQVGARVYEEQVPVVTIPPFAAKCLRGRKVEALQMALHGGDDYGLLFTVAARNARRLARAPEFRDLTAIGEITKGRKILLVARDGGSKPLQPRGWDPFRRS